MSTGTNFARHKLERCRIVNVRFSQSARRHRIGRGSALYVIAHTVPRVTVTRQGRRHWWQGFDERGRELEIGAVAGSRDGVVLVIHVMPVALRRR